MKRPMTYKEPAGTNTPALHLVDCPYNHAGPHHVQRTNQTESNEVPCHECAQFVRQGWDYVECDS